MDAVTAGILGSLSGAVVGALISWLAAISVLRKQEKYKAGAEFKSAFIEIQRLLEIKHPNHSTEYHSAFSVLKSNYVPLRKALLIYKQSGSCREARKLESNWKEFCTFDEDHQIPTFDDYEVADHNHEVEVEKRDLALDRIRKILAIAKIK